MLNVVVPRVQSGAIKQGIRDARINSISPSIIITPFVNDELKGQQGENSKNVIDLCSVHRAGTADEVGELAIILMPNKTYFISGADFLIDGRSTASYGMVIYNI